MKYAWEINHPRANFPNVDSNLNDWILAHENSLNNSKCERILKVQYDLCRNIVLSIVLQCMSHSLRRIHFQTKHFLLVNMAAPSHCEILRPHKIPAHMNSY